MTLPTAPPDPTPRSGTLADLTPDERAIFRAGLRGLLEALVWGPQRRGEAQA